tara:strand:- start:4182 stop:5912 length:1731 start_codon:yes stop_codon:yes gene_type:complete
MLKTAFEKMFKMREAASRHRPGADTGYDAHEKPFLDHLEDLRHTLMKIGGTLAVATMACFTFHTKIFNLIQVPAKMPLANISEGVSLWEKLELITLSPPEFIVLMLKLSFYSGVILTFPFLLYFLFQFILPGLRQVEKKAVIPGAIVGFLLFLIGASFAFFLAAPVALKFFYVFENERISNIDPTQQALAKPIADISLIGVDGVRFAPIGDGKEIENQESEGKAPSKSKLSPEMRQEVRDMVRDSFATIEHSNFVFRYDDSRDKLVIVASKGGKSIYRIGEYISFIARLVLVFGISFQLPVVVSILVKLELLTARVMRATRTYAWIIILVAAAILTPPDIMTLGLLGGPMIILYEICIVIASVIEKGRDKKERAEEEARRTRIEKLHSKPADELSEEEKAEIHRHEIEQYEKDHADLFDEESGHGSSDKVARSGLHGDDHAEHDESWKADDHYWHDGHEDDPDHADDASPKPVKDWPDREEDGMESDHAESEDLSSEKEDSDDDGFNDDEACEPSGPVVDMNHATVEELMSLSGIGPKLAEAIIEHRPFETFDDLEKIPGLSQDKINGMIDRLMLG